MSRVGIIKRRQQGRVDVVCPVCRGRHWLPADQPTGQCPRKHAPAFAIRQPNKEKNR